MKILYVLDNLKEYASALSNVRQPEDKRPLLTGRLEVYPKTDQSPHRVELVGDVNYRMTLTFKSFVVQLAELAKVDLCGRDFI
jgi:hypothetical protein